MVEDAADGIFLSDVDGVYLDVNEVGARMLGMTRDEVIGKRTQDIVADSEQASLTEMRARVGAGEWVLREWQIRRKDGSVFTAEVSAKQLPDGRFQGIWRDVTARRTREDLLRRDEQRFRTLTAAAFEGIGITERGVIIDANEQLARLLGYERSELLGKDVTMIAAPESRDARQHRHALGSRVSLSPCTAAQGWHALERRNSSQDGRVVGQTRSSHRRARHQRTAPAGRARESLCRSWRPWVDWRAVSPTTSTTFWSRFSRTRT